MTALVALLATTPISISAAGAASSTPGASSQAGGGTHSSSSAKFLSSVGLVTTAQLGATWHAGCPVGAGQLRVLKMSYVGFDKKTHRGTLVVNESVTAAVLRVFKLLYEARFPISEMVPESVYHGNDNAAAAADDTSGFNCRSAVAPGAPRWSVHAYGEAIDVNDIQNPYIDGAMIIPPAGAPYANRKHVRPGMAVLHGTLVDAFAVIGWRWGGRWAATPDYQHFSLTGG
jgi:D-alanyl-D-alanine carboxypeptidase